ADHGRDVLARGVVLELAGNDTSDEAIERLLLKDVRREVEVGPARLECLLQDAVALPTMRRTMLQEELHVVRLGAVRREIGKGTKALLTVGEPNNRLAELAGPSATLREIVVRSCVVPPLRFLVRPVAEAAVGQYLDARHDLDLAD